MKKLTIFKGMSIPIFLAILTLLFGPNLLERLGFINISFNEASNSSTDLNIYNKLDELKSKAVFNPRKSSFKILLLPFNPDRNCTSINTDYETQLIHRYRNIEKKRNLNIEVELSSRKVCPATCKEAQRLGQEENADFVIWGNYEEEINGKMHLRLRFVNVHKNYIGYRQSCGDTGLQELYKLGDLRKGYLQNDLDNLLYLSLVEREMYRRNYEIALTFIDQININECNYWLQLSKATCHSKLNNKEEALKHSNLLVDCSVGYELPRAFMTRGRILFSLNKKEESIQDFISSIESEDSLLRKYVIDDITNFYIKESNLDKFEEDFKKVLESQTLNYHIASVYIREEQNCKRAFTYLNQEDDTDDINALKIKCFCIEGKTDEAFSIYKKLSSKDSNLLSDIYQSKASNFLGQGKIDSAEYYYNKIVEISPSSQFSYSSRAIFYSKTKKYKLAVEDFTKAIDLSDGASYLLEARAEIFEEINNFQAAVEDWKKLIKKHPREISYYLKIAKNYSDLRDDIHSKKYLNLALEIQPSSEYDWHEKAEVYNALGQSKGELQTYFNAVKKYSNSSYLYKRIGDFYYNNENYKESLDMYSKAIKIDSSKAYIFYNRGFTHWELGEQTSAIQDWYKSSLIEKDKFYAERYKALAKTADFYWWIPFESIRFDLAYTKAHYKPEFYYYAVWMIFAIYVLFPLMVCYVIFLFWKIRLNRKLRLKQQAQENEEIPLTVGSD